MILSHKQLNYLRDFLRRSYVRDYNMLKIPFKNILTRSNSCGLTSIPIFIKNSHISESASVISKCICHSIGEYSTVYSIFKNMRTMPWNCVREIKIKNKDSYLTYYIANGFIADSDFNVILTVCENYDAKKGYIHYTLYISTRVFHIENCIEKYVKNTIIPNSVNFIGFIVDEIQLISEMPFVIFTPDTDTLLKNENSIVLNTATRILNSLK